MASYVVQPHPSLEEAISDCDNLALNREELDRYKAFLSLRENQYARERFTSGVAQSRQLDAGCARPNKLWETIEEVRLAISVFEYHKRNDEFFSNPEKVREAVWYLHGKHPIKAQALLIGDKDFAKAYQSPSDAFEYIMKAAINDALKTERDHGDFLDAAADYLIGINCMAIVNWLYTVSTVFADYCTEEDLQRERYDLRVSLLQILNEKTYRIMQKLIDEAVKRSTQTSIIGSLESIIVPLYLYNLDLLNPDKLEEPFSFKPDSLTNPDFARVISSGEYPLAPLVIYFCEAKTPKDFFTKMVRQNLPFHKLTDKSFLDSTKVKALLEAIARFVPRNVMSDYLRTVYGSSDGSLHNVNL